ncbi:LysE family translocator [Pontibacterium granulatum]|uniref:LysE family translocator n=1 Tax=Pontibacterium granulatum TaxID=2036029 RepID=UPI002499E49F|nr:LysE family translocator [Pontibacterium granulatum]MDI3323266.1 LysE family translocator [Pontibacterium granulatum]
MSLELLFPAAFPALVLAHFVALLSPGQDFFLISANTIGHGLRGSRFICVGVALGNAVYIAIAILGWSGIRDNPVIFTVIEFAGALYLLWIGLQLLRSKPQLMTGGQGEIEAPSVLKQLLLGINSALLNPKNALFYMSLMAVILGPDVTLVQQLSCGVWMMLTVLLWDLFVAWLIGLPKIRERLNRRIHWVERGAGVVLASLGVGIFLQTGR